MFGVKVTYVVLRYKSSDFGIVVSRFKIIQLRFCVVIISAVSERIYFRYSRSILYYRAVSPGVVRTLRYYVPARIDYILLYILIFVNI